jgi:iron complex transport system permease protein
VKTLAGGDAAATQEGAPGAPFLHVEAAQRRLRLAALFTFLLLLSAAAFLTAIVSGSIEIRLASAWHALFASDDADARSIVWGLRLPRALAAYGTGAALAFAGCLMQVLLRNPLADPYVLGVSGGAAVAALSGLLAGLSYFWLQPLAFCGALVSVLLVFYLGRSDESWSHSRLLLTGVVVAAGWGALITLLLALAPDTHLRGMLFWLIGDLSGSEAAWPTYCALGLALVAVWPLGRDLNLLARGELLATTLGLPVTRLRWLIYALASLLTAAAVTTAGAIGFVGLLVPHMVRFACGGDHRVLLPASALAGGAYLTLADTLARTLRAPLQLPVGAVTALIGVPLFILLLRGRSR